MQTLESSITGLDLKEAYEYAALYLEEHIDELNAMNVFPVPDGDTGINMYLTMKSAVEAMHKTNTFTATAISSTAARGALLGARGNSGVILSQILKGIASGLEGKATFNLNDFTTALSIATEQAYKTVANPVEGTILTVIREVTEAALKANKRQKDFTRTIMSLVLQAKKTVKKTPEMLPVLKEAGVVDSGAKGLYYVFEGMKDAICGKNSQKEVVESSYEIVHTTDKEYVYGFDLQFMIQGTDLPLNEIRDRVVDSGTSPLVVGDETLIRVHVHTFTPDDVIKYARSKGEVVDLVIENLDQQVLEKNQKK